MSETKIRDKFKELNMTEDEVKRFSEAMKKEEFRKLLLDYAQEISDPANRELYEREISALEAERGVNVTFIHPDPGYCIKTTQESTNGEIKKCFVNVCKNDQIEKPTCKREAKGVSWSLPHSCSPPREDFDSSSKQKTCIVYDVVFNPDAFRMGQTNERFDRLLVDSAFETIEKNFNIKLDKVNFKKLKNMNFKGKPTACVLRKTLANEANENKKPKDKSESNQDDQIGSIIDQLKEQYMKDGPSTVKSNTKPIPTSKTTKTTSSSLNNNNNNVEEDSTLTNFTKPSYKLIHSGKIDMQDYAQPLVDPMQQISVESTRPKELIVQIELPLCKSSENVVLDIFEKRLYLKSLDPNYLLDLKLPYPIKEGNAKAKFDKSRRCLNVNLPVVPFVAKVDIVNVDHLSDDDTSRNNDNESLSPSPSSSSASSLTNESNLDAAISSQQQQQQQQHSPAPCEQVKYTLLTSLKLAEYKNAFSIEVQLANYNQQAIELKFLTPSEIRLKCESVSSSGYVQYYLVYLKFVSTTSQEPRQYDLIDSSLLNLEYSTKTEQKNDKFTIQFKDNDAFRISINKTDNNQEKKRAFISLDPITCFQSIPDSGCLDVNQDSINTNFDVTSNTPAKKTDCANRKEFIMNFAINSNQALDEEDEDDLKPENESSKLAQKISAKAATESEIKLLANKTHSKDMRNLEEEFLEDKINESDNESEDECKSNENIASPLSSSVGSSSLNSYSFSKIKGILKKPRSSSESENNSSCASPEVISNSSDNHSTPNYRHSFSDGASVLDTPSSAESASGLKKSVSFNKQVVRNIFKPGSTIAGMKKPNSNKNKKKKQNQQRKRTISDPCMENSSEDGLNYQAAPFTRSRSVSDSSEDAARFLLSPNDSREESACKKNSRKKKKNQNNVNKEAKHENNNPQADSDEALNKTNNNTSSSKCSIQFKNKFVASLDD